MEKSTQFQISLASPRPGATLHPRYITNEAGEKTAVILSIDEYQELIEDIEDLAAVADRRSEPTVSHETLLAALKTDGLLSD